VTLAKLDSADEVKNLRRHCQANRGLDDDLAQLKKIEEVAQDVADVAALLPKVVEGLAQILPLLA